MANCEYIVSACLAGQNCRYDGSSRPCAKIMALCSSGQAIAVCPESFSGLPVPREPCERKGESIIMRNGNDVTEAFEHGAAVAFQIALASGCHKAILKAYSPSCGIGNIYDGSFSGKTCPGNGVFAQKLLNAGFEMWTEMDLASDTVSRQLFHHGKLQTRM